VADPQLEIMLELRGRRLTNLTSWSLNSAFFTSTDGFSFTVYDTDRKNLRGLELEPIEVILNGQSQGLGRIDVTTTGDNGSAVHCQGRDYIADIVECNIDPWVQFKEGMTVSDAIALACAPCGITGVISDDDVALRNIRTGKSIASTKAPKNFRAAKMDDYKPKPGEGIYEVCNRIVARQGATIQPAASRTQLVLAAPHYNQEPAYRIERTADGSHNTIISATATRDYSSFPTYTLFHGRQSRPGEPPTVISSTDIVTDGGVRVESSVVKPGKAGSKSSEGFDMEAFASAFSSEMFGILDGTIAEGRQRPDKVTSKPPKLYRLLYLDDKDARNLDQIYYGAKRAIAERLKDTLSYRVRIPGVIDSVSGAVWSVDTMVHVIDEICGIDETLWISERTLSFDPGSGATTELVCWRPESFQVE
jgi:prophage tail gpP-like protein